MSPASRLVQGRVLPDRAGYYLGLRLIESYLAEHGLARTVRAAAEDIQRADDAATGVQTA